MSKNITTALIFLFAITASAQETISKFTLALKKDRDVFQIVDPSKKEVSLFVSDKNNVKAIRLDAGMRIVDSVTAARPEKKYTSMIGNNKSESGNCLFWSTGNMKEIQSQRFNFATRKVTSENYSLLLKDEKVIQKFSENGMFYILTVMKNSNTIKLYSIDPAGKLNESALDLRGFHFYTPAYELTTFYGYFNNSSLKRITSESPTSLTDSSIKGKFYSSENQVTMTFDDNFDYTQLLMINLDTFTATEKFIKKPFMAFVNRSDLNSNSFLFNDKLYQVKISSEKMILTIKDLNDNLLKEYLTLGEQPIEFKNSDIIQENGDMKNTRILEKTSQFLRKINNAKLGISCYRLDGDLLVTLGSVSDEQSSTGSLIVGGMIGGAAGAIVAYSISSPTMDNFNSYANRKVVYINCLFDENGNHVTGTVKPLAFDSIRAFSGSNRNASSETLYKLENTYYLGYYDNAEKEYVLRKFRE